MARPFVIALFVAALALPSAAQAQGLLWSLPPDGAWVRYQGDYTQTVFRPNSQDGDLELQWRRYLTIKSVGQLDVTIAGEAQPVPCRWIEIKVETGQVREGLIDAGPGGIRTYKLLVREDAIEGALTRQVGPGEIFVSYIPLVQGLTMQDGMQVDVGPGWRKLGELPAEELEGEVFQLYPAVSLLRHYRNLEQQGAPQPIQTPLGDGMATEYEGTMVMETSAHRSTNTADSIIRSDDVPFGLFAWEATTTTERKVTVEPRASFQPTVRITEKMSLIEAYLQGAETELVTDGAF